MSIEKNLLFSADTQALPQVLDELDALLESAGCPDSARTQLAVAIEEIFVNIANYAYEAAPEKGQAGIDVKADAHEVTIRFTDSGTPYNPLEKEDPDIDQEAIDRPIGGLGVFLVKQMTDDVAYENTDGKNILTIVKKY